MSAARARVGAGAARDRDVQRRPCGAGWHPDGPGWPAAAGAPRLTHIDADDGDAKMPALRTTIDLDPDIDARLRALARERRVSLRTVINDILRAGIDPARGAT